MMEGFDSYSALERSRDDWKHQWESAVEDIELVQQEAKRTITTALTFLNDALEETGQDEEELCSEPGTVWVRILSARSVLMASYERPEVA